MNIKRAIFAFGMALGLSFLASQSFAQGVICQPIVPGTQWPNGDFTQACSFDGLNNPSDAGQMNSTLQDIASGTWKFTDASARLKGFVLTEGDFLTIKIENDNIPQLDHTVTVKYTVQEGDHLSTVAAKLAKRINNRSDLQAAGFSAQSFGTQLQITSPSTGNTVYTVGTNPGATETIAIDPAGLVTIGGTTEHPFGNFYIFSTNADYFSSNEPKDQDGNTVALTDDASGNTPQDLETLQPLGWSIVLQQDGNGHSRFNTPNTTAHELGHWLDFIYANTGVLPSRGTQIHIEGTITVGDTYSIRVENANLKDGFRVASYTAQSGDTLDTVVQNLTGAINSDNNLQNRKFSAATHDDGFGRYILIYSDNNKPTLYVLSVSPGATATLSQLGETLATKSKIWRAALAADWAITNGLPICSYYTGSGIPGDYHPGLFSGRKDPNGNYFCDNNSDPDVFPHYAGDGENLQGAYAGLGSNQEVMEAAWPDFFTADTEETSAEIFAEEVAIFFFFTDWKYKSGPNAGQEDPIHLDRNFHYSDGIWHNHQFTCTHTLIDNLLLNGEAKIPAGAGAMIGKLPNETFYECPVFE